MTKLRDFFYLDASRVRSFVSQIHGGLISEINETITSSGGLKGGLKVPVGGFDASKQSGSEHQQTIQLTDNAYFSALYKYLKDEKEIVNLSNTKIEKIKSGQFIEIENLAQPPVIDAWLKRVNNIVDFMDRNIKLLGANTSSNQKRQKARLNKKNINGFREMVNLLEDYIKLVQADTGKLYINLPDAFENGTIWCGLLPEYCTIPIHSALPSKVTLVGKVEKFLEQGETWKLVDFEQLNQTNENIEQLFTGINSMADIMNMQQMSKDDFLVEHPAVFVTPVAIYR